MSYLSCKLDASTTRSPAMTTASLHTAPTAAQTAAPQIQLSLLAPEPLAPQALAQGGGDAIAWQIGFDHARHGLPLPSAHLHEGSPLFNGWQTALNRQSQRHRDPAPGVRRWLALRLQAWQEGVAFEDQLLTPHYLVQLDTSHCPITREELHDEVGHTGQRTIVSLLPAQGYAAGCLVMMSRVAALALRDRSLAGIRERGLAAAYAATPLDGLDAMAWARLASLIEAVSPEAVPTVQRLLPPNRLHLANPSQALQAWVTRQLAHSGWSHRLLALHDALPGEAARQAASSLSAALAPHALQVPVTGMAQRWALEDLWLDERVQRRWTALVSLLSPLTIERLLRQLPPPQGWTVESHHASFRSAALAKAA
jgi:hypothetical protein